MIAAIKPNHISDADWLSIQQLATQSGAALTETNQEFWESEFYRIKSFSGEV